MYWIIWKHQSSKDTSTEKEEIEKASFEEKNEETGYCLSVTLTQPVNYRILKIVQSDTIPFNFNQIIERIPCFWCWSLWGNNLSRMVLASDASGTLLIRMIFSTIRCFDNAEKQLVCKPLKTSASKTFFFSSCNHVDRAIGYSHSQLVCISL